MKDLFNNIPNANNLREKKELTLDSNKELEIKKQVAILAPELEKLTKDERITVNFAVIQELRENLYSKGYNTIVNGKETIISIRDPKEDMIDEWTTFDCGN